MYFHGYSGHKNTSQSKRKMLFCSTSYFPGFGVLVCEASCFIPVLGKHTEASEEAAPRCVLICEIHNGCIFSLTGGRSGCEPSIGRNPSHLRYSASLCGPSCLFKHQTISKLFISFRKFSPFPRCISLCSLRLDICFVLERPTHVLWIAVFFIIYFCAEYPISPRKKRIKLARKERKHLCNFPTYILSQVFFHNT